MLAGYLRKTSNMGERFLIVGTGSELRNGGNRAASGAEPML